MNIIEKRLDEVIPYANNPRDNSGAIEKVVESIRDFGFKVPIVIDKDNVIVAGHTRVLAAKTLGMDTVPAIMADDLTEEQIKAYRIADNSTAELSGWDFGKLDRELDSIRDIDMTRFGFQDAMKDCAVDALFMDDEKVEPKEIQCPYCGEWFVP